MKIEDLSRAEAEGIIESLRSGLPPERFVSLYSSGEEETLLESVRKRHFATIGDRGRIRFVSGSWGSGKTHFLRRLRETAFEDGLLVANVQLTVQQAPFSHFERVVFEIVRNLCSPELYFEGELSLAAPLGETLHRVLLHAAEQAGEPDPALAVPGLCNRLSANDHIDVDVRRAVEAYWSTYAHEDPESERLRDRRATLLQWFVGEGQPGLFRKEFGLQKTITKENARIVLRSLASLATALGYRGLVVLFDEAEMAHTVMRNSELKQAHNNLLALINEVENSEGLFLVYATVPEFFISPKVGIVQYGALSQRIGALEDERPRALAKVWNLDSIQPTLGDLNSSVEKIRQIYIQAFPESAGDVAEVDLERRVEEQYDMQGPHSEVSTWRVVVTAVIKDLDYAAEGLELPEPVAARRAALDDIRNA